MDAAPETRGRWRTAATVAYWIIVYFWAVWLFDQFLPERSDQTVADMFFQRQVGNRAGEGGTSAPSSPEARDQAERQAAESQ